MDKKWFKKLVPGTTLTGGAVVTDVEERQNYRGEPYCNVGLSDGETKIIAKCWNSIKDYFDGVTLISATVTAKMFKDAVTYELTDWGAAPPGENVADYVLSAPLKPEDMYDEILRTCESCSGKESDHTAYAVTEFLYTKYKTPLLTWAAGKSVHHAYYGGLLYHALRMVRAADKMAEVYTSLDKELLVCGAALHDIGKIRELDTNAVGSANYTVDGSLFGHLMLGVEMIGEAERSIRGLNSETIRLLKHMIASHHGTREFGALVIPATAEAIMLHELDMIDSRMEIVEEQSVSAEPGEMTQKVFALDAALYVPNTTLPGLQVGESSRLADIADSDN